MEDRSLLSKNEKISKTLKETNAKADNCTCSNCGNSFYRKPSKIREHNCCSRSCSTTWKNKTLNMCSSGGKASVLSQQGIRRSLNEMYFAELCKKEFLTIENAVMFNGWDADIVLANEKIAILWNGKWHYEKITKKHSVEQVQNRDKKKIEEITKAGYTPYVIKDMGKHNKEFVEKEFEKLKTYIAG